MRALLALLVLLSVWPCEAQVRRRVLGPRPSAGGGVTLPSGLLYDWVSTNLFDPVTNWTDLVSSYTITNNANFPRFTNGLGVHFDGTQFLLFSNNIVQATNMCQMVVCKIETAAGFVGHFIIGYNLGRIITTWNGQWYSSGGTWGTVVDGKTYDVISTGNNSGVGQGPVTSGFYTNGVLATAEQVNSIIYSMGAKGDGSQGLQGTVYEYLIFTNINLWTVSDFNKLHQYSTNRWPHSP